MGVEDNAFYKFMVSMYYTIEAPVVFFREKIVLPNQQKYPWYHEKFRRVPTIDQCYIDDYVCSSEADAQLKRDKLVDDQILTILRTRFEHCNLYYDFEDSTERCAELEKIYNENAANWFSKYGDLGVGLTARRAYMKQKHRMIWERRHGKIGSGMKGTKYTID